MFVEDVARANLLAAQTNAPAQAFNVGSGQETSLLQLAETLLRVIGSDLRVQYADERKVNAVRRRLADVSGANRQLGFSAQVSLEEGLRRLVEWQKEQA